MRDSDITTVDHPKPAPVVAYTREREREGDITNMLRVLPLHVTPGAIYIKMSNPITCFNQLYDDTHSSHCTI